MTAVLAPLLNTWPSSLPVTAPPMWIKEIRIYVSGLGGKRGAVLLRQQDWGAPEADMKKMSARARTDAFYAFDTCAAGSKRRQEETGACTGADVFETGTACAEIRAEEQGFL
jgi:hypothetical protein